MKTSKSPPGASRGFAQIWSRPLVKFERQWPWKDFACHSFPSFLQFFLTTKVFQVLQLEIQTEGQSQINRLFNQIRWEACSTLTKNSFRSECDPSLDHYGRKKSNADAIRKKWHTLYLSSLSLQFRIEDLLNKAQVRSSFLVVRQLYILFCGASASHV